MPCEPHHPIEDGASILDIAPCGTIPAPLESDRLPFHADSRSAIASTHRFLTIAAHAITAA